MNVSSSHASESSEYESEAEGENGSGAKKIISNKFTGHENRRKSECNPRVAQKATKHGEDDEFMKL